jgi:hypothetical protein
MANPTTPTAKQVVSASVTLEGTAPGKLIKFKPGGWQNKGMTDVSTLESALYAEELPDPLAKMQDSQLTVEWDGTDGKIFAPTTTRQTVLFTLLFLGGTSTTRTVEADVLGWDPEEISVDGNRLVRATFTLHQATPWSTPSSP